MMYCPRCNNTHWTRTEASRAADHFAILRLKRSYRCNKCGRIQLGSVFLDFKWPKLSEKKRKKSPPKKENVKCPNCGGEVRRSRRRGLERFLIFWRAYRCSHCDIRFRSLKA